MIELIKIQIDLPGLTPRSLGGFGLVSIALATYLKFSLSLASSIACYSFQTHK